MNGRSVNGYSLLRADIRAILEISMLAFLFCLQIQPRKTTKILLNNSLIYSCAAPDTFTVVVGHPVQSIDKFDRDQ